MIIIIMTENREDKIIKDKHEVTYFSLITSIKYNLRYIKRK